MSRHPDRMIQADLLLNCSFNRGDASTRTWASRTPTIGAGATFANRALDLSGTSTGWVTYPHDAALGTPPLTVMAWIYIDTYSGVRNIVSKIPQSTSYTGWALWLSPGYLSGGLRFHNVNSADTSVTAGEYRAVYTASGALAAGSWYHVAATLSAYNAHAILYINGAAASVTQEGTGASMTTISNSEPLRVGLKGGPESVFWSDFDGKIDDLRIYNRVLSASEIAAIRSSGRE